MQKILNEKQIDVKLHSGTEIYISEEFEDLIKSGTILPLANSKYVLIELPMNNTLKNLDEILFLVKAMGYQIIIAHPERYKDIKQDINFAQKLVNEGCLLQANFGSIIGLYGKESQKIIKKLLKLNLVSFLGSDVHIEGTIYKMMPKIIKKLKKVISEDKLYEITTSNPSKILNI